MLKAAQNYADEIGYLFRKTWYQDKYKYYYNGCFHSEFEICNDTCENHQFASVKDEVVIGYIGYSIDRVANVVYDLNVINFDENLVTFGKDLAQAIDDIFMKYSFNKIEFSVFVGNPAEKMYDKFIKITGGRVVGTLSQHVKLIDGKIYDLKMYELFRKNYMKHRESFLGIK